MAPVLYIGALEEIDLMASHIPLACYGEAG